MISRWRTPAGQLRICGCGGNANSSGDKPNSSKSCSCAGVGSALLLLLLLLIACRLPLLSQNVNNTSSDARWGRQWGDMCSCV
jgi:hypothetical protein